TAAGAEPLALTAGTGGDLLFTGAVGSGVRLGAVTIASANDVTEQAGLTAASLAQASGTGTTTLNGPVHTDTAAGVALTTNAITLNSSLTTTGTG
ncbi:hypothetical protein PTM75_15105, partial [Clostridium perfringens]|nr:hypothetical protein [Clostridium perfringens]